MEILPVCLIEATEHSLSKKKFINISDEKELGTPIVQAPRPQTQLYYSSDASLPHMPA